MWNEPDHSRLDKIPLLHENGGTPRKDKLIYLHFFISSCDWFATEFDGEDTFFGYSILNGDYHNAEWGYFSFKKLRELSIGWVKVGCEAEDAWKTRKANFVPAIGRM